MSGIVDSFETLAFYRGMSASYPSERPFIKQPRTNRRPKDSPIHFHDAADTWFLKRFGVRYRSQVVCVTSRALTAQTYAYSAAHVMRILPLSRYKYCWSPKVSDLLFVAKEMAEAGTEEIGRFLDGADYRESGLEEAHQLGCEVMLHCTLYVGIPASFLPRGDTEPASGILLPYA